MKSFIETLTDEEKEKLGELISYELSCPTFFQELFPSLHVKRSFNRAIRKYRRILKVTKS